MMVAPTNAPRTLLLTLDAFNTLFQPREPIPVIYTRVAQSLRVIPRSVTPAAITPAFKAAYKRNLTKYPNYGRDTPGFGGPNAWWGRVIRESFAEVKGGNFSADDIPDALVAELLTTFGSDAGYKLYDDTAPFFNGLQLWKETMLRGSYTSPWDRVIVGVVSNADDRIFGILKSLGLRVGSFWANNGQLMAFANENPKTDIDFVVTSYEAGKEKPNKHIFQVAEKRAEYCLKSREPLIDKPFPGPGDLCVHVGDDYHADYRGAKDAGWESYLLIRDDVGTPSLIDEARSILKLDELLGLLQIGTGNDARIQA